MSFERYDRIVDHYATMWPLIVPGYEPILAAMREVVRSREARPSEILDLGCGTAGATGAVAPACAPNARVTLVDGSKRMLAAARTLLGPRVRAGVCADFLERGVLPEVAPHREYDLALCSFALQHWTDAQKRYVIEVVAHSLRPGALFLLADEIVAELPAGWDVVGRTRARMLGDHLAAGRVPREFWELETSLPPEFVLPFRPSRPDELTSTMARAGLAVSSPVTYFGTALFVGVKPG